MGERLLVLQATPPHPPMRFLLPLVVLLAFPGCDSSPATDSVASVGHQGAAKTSSISCDALESGSIAYYNYGAEEKFDLYYNLWDEGSQASHSVVYLDEFCNDIVEYKYVVGSTEARLYVRWPGVAMEKSGFSFQYRGDTVGVTDLYAVNADSEGFMAIGSADFSGTSVHVKPGEMRVDNSFNQVGTCSLDVFRNRWSQVFNCTDFGVDFDVTPPQSYGFAIRPVGSYTNLQFQEGIPTTDH